MADHVKSHDRIVGNSQHAQLKMAGDQFIKIQIIKYFLQLFKHTTEKLPRLKFCTAQPIKLNFN